MSAGVSLDVALSWVVGRCTVVNVVLCDEGDRLRTTVAVT